MHIKAIIINTLIVILLISTIIIFISKLQINNLQPVKEIDINATQKVVLSEEHINILLNILSDTPSSEFFVSEELYRAFTDFSGLTIPENTGLEYTYIPPEPIKDTTTFRYDDNGNIIIYYTSDGVHFAPVIFVIQDNQIIDFISAE